jgi:hypothetical protein
MGAKPATWISIDVQKREISLFYTASRTVLGMLLFGVKAAEA